MVQPSNRCGGVSPAQGILEARHRLLNPPALPELDSQVVLHLNAPSSQPNRTGMIPKNLCPLLALLAALNSAPGHEDAFPPSELSLRAAFHESARPSITNLLAETEQRIGLRLVFVPLPDNDEVVARSYFDPFRNQPQIQLRQGWQDVDVAHELMHLRMDLLEEFSLLAWRRDVPHTPAVEAAFGRVQTYVNDEVVHARLTRVGFKVDGEIFRPPLFDSLYSNAAQ